MIRISNIHYPIDKPESGLEQHVINEYSLSGVKSFELAKKSVDARKKSDVHYVYSVDVCCENEARLIKKYKNISAYMRERYEFPKGNKKDLPIVVAGFGPAGMMCALTLVQNG